MARVTHPVLAWGAAYVLALAAIALWPHHVDSAVDVNRTFVGRWLLDRGFSAAQTYGLIELSANVALYVPSGIFAMVIVPTLRWWKIVIIALVVSSSAELVQGLLPGRTATVQDVVANTAGAAIGVALVVGVRAIRRRAGRG